MAHIPYASVVGSLMYVMVCTRLDIVHVVGALSRYMSTPRKDHWTTVKRIFRYLCATQYYVICYQGKPGGDSELNVHGFIDVYWARDLYRWSSISGYEFKMFSGVIIWMSKRQAVLALSTRETEYMTTNHGRKEAVWLQRFY
jgi:hypothetical protein